MISVTFYSADGGGAALVGFRSSGHAGVRGQSIVCAAVSSACYMAANTITEILGVDARIAVDDGDMRVMTSGDGAVRAQAVLQGLRLHIEQLRQQYPGQIKTSLLEVQHNA